MSTIIVAANANGAAVVILKHCIVEATKTGNFEDLLNMANGDARAGPWYQTHLIVARTRYRARTASVSPNKSKAYKSLVVYLE